MENKSPTSLLSSLKKVVEHPKEYLADICCTFEDNNEIWLHKGILLSRCPLIFRQYFLSALEEQEQEEEEEGDSDDEYNSSCIIIHLDHHHISYSLFKIFVTYWYTTEWPTLLSLTLQKEIKEIETLLNYKLLPPINEEERINQFLIDMEQMMTNQLGADIDIKLESSSPSSSDNSKTLFSAHRFLLASRSTYFYAMFCTEFLESHHHAICLTDSFFSPIVIQVIFHYLYLDTIFIPSPFPQYYQQQQQQKHYLTKQQKFTLKKHHLRVLQLTYDAVDYLGEMNTFGKNIMQAMINLCDGLKCLCHDCALLLPSMLSFIDKKKGKDEDPHLYNSLIQLYSDPVHAINHLWSQKPFAMLTASMLPSAASLMKSLDPSCIAFFDEQHQPTSTMIHEITDLTFRHITKHNAIHVLHSLHLCFSKLRSADLIPTWSLPTLDLLSPILQSTVSMVSQNFDFYCTEYPILVSCVDGIGCGFSVDFLEFLLSHILNHGIQDTNAGIIYQGIVKDLIGRQETVKNIALDDVLLNARMKCAEYLSRRWLSVKSLGGFRSLEKAIVRQLSDDIGVPYRTLTKPLDYDLLSLFTFKPKSAKYNFKNKSSDNNTNNTNNNNDITASLYQHSFLRNNNNPNGRRRSHGVISSSSHSSTIQTNKKSQGSTNTNTTTTTRPRSHSAGPSSTVYRSDPTNSYVNYNSLSALSSQPLIHLLSMEQKQHSSFSKLKSFSTSSSSSSTTTLNQSSSSSSLYQHDNGSMKSLMDILLPMDELNHLQQQHHHHYNNNNDKDNNNSSGGGNERSTTLKFELPVAGSITRAKSPVHPSVSIESLNVAPHDLSKKKKKQYPTTSSKKKNYKYSSSPNNKKSKWGFHSDISDDEDTIMMTPIIGAKVMLNRRPLPTFGTIQYVGRVDFAKGEWIGLELESRLGKNNGTVAGITYFTTDAQRGIFVRPDDFTIVSIPSIA
ncbi:hypothetical protein BJ944DRAFT_242175 [Cunninghamella echinulata]|nr:hypothetical protein BJ944DRAFT_242175 [Cunninghamella echinulata]